MSDELCNCAYIEGEHLKGVANGCLYASPRLPSSAEEPDLVNHPPHYGSHPSGVECITVTEHFNFNMGNAIKYIWRADEKGNPLQDLEKAKWYIEREIKKRTSEG